MSWARVWLLKFEGLIGLLFLYSSELWSQGHPGLISSEEGPDLRDYSSSLLLVTLTVKAQTCRMFTAYLISCHIPAFLPPG